MKISVLVISNNELIASQKNDSLSLLTSTLHKNGFEVESLQYIKAEYNTILSQINTQLEINKNIILAVENLLEASFITKKALNNIFNDQLITNEYAQNNIENFFKTNNIPPTKEGITESYFPSKARCITNQYGIMQGCLIEENEKRIIMMPLEQMQLKKMFITAVLPYLLEVADKLGKTYVFKTFGLTQRELLSSLKELRKNKHKINIICNEKLLDGEVIIENNPRVKQENTDNLVMSVYNKLSPYIYAESDYSLAERLKDLLALKKLNFCTAEEVTGGKVASTFLQSFPLAEQYLYEGYITTKASAKNKVLGVNKETIALCSYSSEVAYQMAIGALDKSGCDYVVSTTGCLNEASQDYGKCSICVGNIQGIHVYKHTFFGERNEIISKITNAAFFHLIKKIRQNDSLLSKNTI